MKKIYVCSPLRGDIEGNLKRAKEYCMSVSDAGHLPVCPHVYFTTFLADDDPHQRELGMLYGLYLLDICDELWYYGEPSEGMAAEIEYARAHGIKVVEKDA